MRVRRRRKYGRQKYRGKKRKKWMKLFLPMLVLLFCLFIFETRILPVIQQVASAKAQSAAIDVISDEVNRIIEGENIQYEGLVRVQMDINSHVSAVTADIAEINRLKATFAHHIQDKMHSIEKMTMKIPLGTLLSKGAFTGYGPRVPIRLTSIGRATLDIEDSFLEAGINQTRHEIHLLVTAKINVLMPGISSATEIQTKIPIAQSVIVGQVPQSVTTVTGVNGEPQDNVLNLLD